MGHTICPECLAVMRELDRKRSQAYRTRPGYREAANRRARELYHELKNNEPEKFAAMKARRKIQKLERELRQEAGK